MEAKKNCSGRVVKAHTSITVQMAKKFQHRVSHILTHERDAARAMTLLDDMLDHFEGHCKDTGSCTHDFPYEKRHPINCPAMIAGIRDYMQREVRR